jgi:hypothetical protein
MKPNGGENLTVTLHFERGALSGLSMLVIGFEALARLHPGSCIIDREAIACSEDATCASFGDNLSYYRFDANTSERRAPR